MDYKEFEVQLSQKAPNLYSASALENGEVVASHKFELRTGELKFIEGMRHLEEGVISPQSEETFHLDFGRDLYNKVFAGELAEYFSKCFKDARSQDDGLRIGLRCDTDAAELAAVPWEFLHDGDGFLVTKRNLLISRLPMEADKRKFDPLKTTLHMLVVISNPEDPSLQPLNTEHEQEVILEAVDRLQRENKIVVDFAEDATYKTIQSYLNDKEYHIVHFTGHGSYHDGKGHLILESEDRRGKEFDNRAIVDLLAQRGIRLVVLSACQSGKISNKEAYADLASILVRENVPAVVAMQYPILDLSATEFASTFYQAITSNKPIDLSLTEARITMKNVDNSNGVDFATPLLYLSDPDCLNVGEIKPEAPEISTKPVMLGEVQVIKKGFVGRQRELRILQDAFLSDVKRAAIIYGFGGIGKTVLATRLALRMSRHLDGFFGTKCKKSTRPEEILNKLNTFLLMDGVDQLNRMINEQAPLKVKTQILVRILNQRHYLIILDNFEDCLNEEDKIENPDLREFVLQLLNGTYTSTKFIVTTRRNFYPLEGRLAGSIEHLSLPELPFPQTVWLMNNHRELADLDIKKKLQIYRAIGGHPWTVGLFARHAAVESVDGLLLELAPLKRELVDFTLLDKSYSKLDEETKRLLLYSSTYDEAVPVEALSWIVGSDTEPSPPIGDPLKKLLDWGLVAKQEELGQDLYTIHTLVKDFAWEEAEKEKLDQNRLLIRAAQHYENLAKTTENLRDCLKARDHYYEAEEWEKAADIVEIAIEYLYRWGQLELAIKLLNQSVNTTSGMKKTRALGSLATMYQGLGDWKSAMKLYSQVREIQEREEQKNNLSITLHSIGNIHYGQGNYNDANKFYHQSLEICKELGDRKGIAGTLLQLGTICHSQGDYDGAIERYQQCLDIFKDINDKIGVSNTLHQFGMVYQDLGRYDEAIPNYHGALDIKKEIGDKRGIASTLHQLGVMHHHQGKYEKAIELYQQSLEISEQISDKEGVASTLRQLGNIHSDQGNFKEAIKLCHQSLKIYKELENKGGIASVLHLIGVIEQKQGNSENAIKLYHQSLEKSEEMGDKESIACSQHQLGTIYQERRDYKEAEKYLKQSLEISKELKHKRNIAYTFGQLGKLYEQGYEDYYLALENYWLSFWILKELDDPTNENAKSNVSRLKQKMGEDVFKKALEGIKRKYGT